MDGGTLNAPAAADTQEAQARSAAERVNARLKDSHGGTHVWVRGHTKVASHLMFGLVVVAAGQLLRLLQ